MANVVINGITYSDVPSIQIPKQGSGTAEFYDTSDATLDSGAKMLDGVTAYANGTKYTGTIEAKTSSDLSASGATVTAPAGYYAREVTYTSDQKVKVFVWEDATDLTPVCEVIDTSVIQ